MSQFVQTVDGGVFEDVISKLSDVIESIGPKTDSTDDTDPASIEAPRGRTAVSVMGSADGGEMTVTVEISTNGLSWYEIGEIVIPDGESIAESYTVGSEYVRAQGDANVGRVRISAKGM